MLIDILGAFNMGYAEEDLKEVSKNNFDEMRCNPTTESFMDVLVKFKKTAKQAYDERANDPINIIAETFQFTKLSIQINHGLAKEEMMHFVQRRCQ